MPSGSTRVAGVIGDPVAHSLSPVIHNAAFRATGLDWVYVAFPTAAGEAVGAVQGMRSLGISGLSVTMPHKAAVIAALDEVDDDAAELGAVNCISRRGDSLIGHNTDGGGFVAALATDLAFDPVGRTCVVLGAGGAARAVVLALSGAGAKSVQVVNRTRSTAEVAAALAGPVGSVASEDAVAGADLVVNATPVGMQGPGTRGGPGLPCDPERLGAGQVVADLIYHPTRTPLMEAAERQGARTSNGVSMLIHQAALAFELWTGVNAPLGAMRAAVADAVEAGGGGAIGKS